MRALRVAIQFLSRLPVAGPSDWRDDDLARALPFFPVVGAGIGLTLGACYAGASALGLPRLAAATLALVVLGPLLTGALHEDGLADTADGLLGGRDRASRLRIMRDSSIGAYGAVALAALLLLRVSLVASMGAVAALAALGLAHGLGRLATVVLMARLPYARDNEEGPGGPMIQHLKPSHLRWAVALGLGLTLGVVPLLQVGALAGVVVASLLLMGLARRARRDLGGVTGDVLGAACTLVEIGVLLAVSVPVSGAG